MRHSLLLWLSVPSAFFSAVERSLPYPILVLPSKQCQQCAAPRVGDAPQHRCERKIPYDHDRHLYGPYRYCSLFGAHVLHHCISIPTYLSAHKSSFIYSPHQFIHTSLFRHTSDPSSNALGKLSTIEQVCSKHWELSYPSYVCAFNSHSHTSIGT